MTHGADPVLTAHPVGDVIETAVGRDGVATAVYDRTGTYRYRLSVVWEAGAGRCAFVLLNPSTATALQPDPTLRRCLRYARDWGFGAVELVNCFALRSAHPRVLRSHPDPVGPGNDGALEAVAAADLVVAAWGAQAVIGGRDQTVMSLLLEAGAEPSCLTVTAGGQPGHPLYLPARLRPRPWRAVG